MLGPQMGNQKYDQNQKKKEETRQNKQELTMSHNIAQI